MKKITPVTAILLAIYLLNFAPAGATVGGPTYIDNIQGDPSKSEIIYVEQSFGGRGCPPEIYSVDVDTQQTRVLVSCNEESMVNDLSYEAKLEATLSKYPILLKRIDLTKNKLTADATITYQEEMNPVTGSFGRTDFNIAIYQNDTLKTTLTYSGCKTNKRLIIEGYNIPNKNSLALVVSSTGICFESGYERERLYIVPNISIYDSNALPIRKGGSVEEKGNLTVVANTIKNPQAVTNTSTDTDTTKLPASDSQPKSIENIPTVNSTSQSPVLGYQIAIGVLFLVILALIFAKRR